MASGKVKVSVYHGFHFNQEPFFNSNKFELNDKISFLMRKIADFLVHVPVDLMLMFHGNNTETPLRGHTNISELTFGLNEIKLYFGLIRCRQSLQLLERKKTKDLKILRRLTVRGFGISNQIITTKYTDRNMAEIYEHIGAITGLPADHLIIFSKDKEVFPYTRESVFDGQEDFRESMIMFVVAYFQENEKMDDICIEYGIKHLKSLKLRFLTKEEELNPREMESIQDIKNYVHKTHNIPLHQQSILFQHQEIEDDSTKIFDLLLQNGVLVWLFICSKSQYFSFRSFFSYLVETFSYLVETFSYLVETFSYLVETFLYL
uniref:Ubiquitin-like domain-containing protein n=1 Tax=Clytia hemisphaerica TaxID=252671 RepID=A0A7M5VBS1_9CNID